MQPRKLPSTKEIKIRSQLKPRQHIILILLMSIVRNSLKLLKKTVKRKMTWELYSQKILNLTARKEDFH
jgi:hypothetical protein